MKPALKVKNAQKKRTSRMKQKTVINRRQAEALLFPIAKFLQIGGLSQKDAGAIFSTAYRKALTKQELKIQHIGHHTHYQDIIGLWTKGRQFVSNTGCPRLLEETGRNSFATLVHEASPKYNPNEVLKILLRYGNVRQTRARKYKLVRRFFVSNTPNSIAFEPIAYFLADASTTARHLLKRNINSRGPSHYWRRVETTELSDTLARKFSLFAKERSLTFLEELDDWLDAHKSESQRKHKKRRRVGVGVFSVYSDPEVIDPSA
jgi:hypothetical protein